MAYRRNLLSAEDKPMTVILGLTVDTITGVP